ncbi:MAG: preprotein translocase subunit SecE [Verrucomicrobia bacterium]|nr:MAG: preprotein translocase subunit SecE [Verrucomicrobiota bacterium]
MSNKITTYIREVRAELAKVQWPWDDSERGFKRYKELWDSTLVVIIAMLLVGGYISFFDFVTINVVGYLTHP